MKDVFNQYPLISGQISWFLFNPDQDKQWFVDAFQFNQDQRRFWTCVHSTKTKTNGDLWTRFRSTKTKSIFWTRFVVAFLFKFCERIEPRPRMQGIVDQRCRCLIKMIPFNQDDSVQPTAFHEQIARSTKTKTCSGKYGVSWSVSVAAFRGAFLLRRFVGAFCGAFPCGVLWSVSLRRFVEAFRGAFPLRRFVEAFCWGVFERDRRCRW